MKKWHLRLYLSEVETMTKSSLTANERLVLIMIKCFVNEKGTGAYPSLERLCQMTNLCRTAVKASIHGLEQKKFIEVTRRSGCRNSYKVTRSPDGPVDGQDRDAKRPTRGAKRPGTGSPDDPDQLKDQIHRSEPSRLSKKQIDQGRTESDLLSRYNGSSDVIQRTLEAITSTRKSSKIAPSVRQAILQKLDCYEIKPVLDGCGIYLDKEYAAQGKREKYLVGIIRGRAKELEQKAANQPKAGEAPKWKWD